MKKLLKECVGELLGTFILVAIGCSTVAGAIVFNAFSGLWQVALVWGAGVTLAIYATMKICPAHLNPAVSVAMSLAGKLSFKKLGPYLVSQFVGAVIAGVIVLLVFGSAIEHFESVAGIERGTAISTNTAMIFGEFFPNPAMAAWYTASHSKAILLEAIGTFILVFVIFSVTYKEHKLSFLNPVFIGFTVAVIIFFVAPYTQAGLNPARDFGPRVVTYFAGWGDAAFPTPEWSFLTVYILAPVLGGGVAFGAHRFIVKK